MSGMLAGVVELQSVLGEFCGGDMTLATSCVLTRESGPEM